MTLSLSLPLSSTYWLFSSRSYCGIKVLQKDHYNIHYFTPIFSSLASVEPPQVWFDLKFPEMVIEEVRLSSLQLEAVVYACQQHMNLLADGTRAGFLIGKLTCMPVPQEIVSFVISILRKSHFLVLLTHTGYESMHLINMC